MRVKYRDNLYIELSEKEISSIQRIKARPGREGNHDGHGLYMPPIFIDKSMIKNKEAILALRRTGMSKPEIVRKIGLSYYIVDLVVWEGENVCRDT